MSDSVTSNENGGFDMGMTAQAPSGNDAGATAAPFGNGDNGDNGDNGGGSAGINPDTVGSDGSGASFAGGGAQVTAFDAATGLSVTAATQNPPLTLPAVQIGIPNYTTVDPQVARDEAVLIGNLTTAVLTKIGVPSLFAASIGGLVNSNLQSPAGLAALRPLNAPQSKAGRSRQRNSISQPERAFAPESSKP